MYVFFFRRPFFFKEKPTLPFQGVLTCCSRLSLCRIGMRGGSSGRKCLTMVFTSCIGTLYRVKSRGSCSQVPCISWVWVRYHHQTVINGEWKGAKTGWRNTSHGPVNWINDENLDSTHRSGGLFLRKTGFDGEDRHYYLLYIYLHLYQRPLAQWKSSSLYTQNQNSHSLLKPPFWSIHSSSKGL
jgi:hypothetical protein